MSTITVQAPVTPPDYFTRVSSERSGSVNELAAALSRAQGKLKGATKDANNPHFGSKYADLASVWDACREALTTEGLAIVQAPCGDGDRVGLTTTLLHGSGQWMASTIYAATERKGPQAVGSVLTYLRRYSLAAFVGVAPDDDDGNAAEPERAPAPANDNARRIAARPSARRNADPPPASDGQSLPSSSGSGPSLASMRKYHALRAELKISEDEGRERVSKAIGRPVASITELTAAEMSFILGKMEGNLNAG